MFGAGYVFGDVGVAACGEEDLFGSDGLLAAVVKDDFGFVLGEEVCSTV